MTTEITRQTVHLVGRLSGFATTLLRSFHEVPRTRTDILCRQVANQHLKFILYGNLTYVYV